MTLVAFSEYLKFTLLTSAMRRKLLNKVQEKVAPRSPKSALSKVGRPNPMRMWIWLRAVTEKFVKMTHLTCPRDSLTNFWYEANAMTGNRSYVHLLKLAYKNFWKHFEWTYFRRVLAQFEAPWAFSLATGLFLSPCTAAWPGSGLWD